MNLIFAFLATALLVVRALSRNSLTTAGILSAVLTALVHALHPWNLPFVLLITFYALAIRATRVKHEVKAKLTVSSSGGPGGEGARNHVQVLANSFVASALILVHCYQLGVISPRGFAQRKDICFHGDIWVIGIIANYASTLGDTLSSELGILSKTPPVLITTLRKTPPGTNGGVTLLGVLAGGAGSAIIGLVSVVLLPYCPLPVDGHGIHLPEGQAYVSPGNSGNDGPTWGIKEKALFVAFVTVIGVFGSLLDSLLGAVFQKSVVDIRTQKIVEGPNGVTVLVQPSSPHLSARARIHSQLDQTPQSAAAAIPASAVASESARHRSAVAVEKDDALEHKQEHEHSRTVISGSRWGVLNNNEVNFAMAILISMGAMVVWRMAGMVGCDSCSGVIG
ncbi:hypothetical protein C7212DRAFT_314106 [Tuber magnatum]|uniref:DUF92-domain-containing protein n=1 Tax=Tuber magnatum TaxID=42249 RepID=A0A317STZ4_9PEZI|nr:hypothetical protein C7212DRAFT_314106 [Tuber magnatum]